MYVVTVPFGRHAAPLQYNVGLANAVQAIVVLVAAAAQSAILVQAGIELCLAVNNAELQPKTFDPRV